jgi:hypothetical protein
MSADAAGVYLGAAAAEGGTAAGRAAELLGTMQQAEQASDPSRTAVAVHCSRQGSIEAGLMQQAVQVTICSRCSGAL